MEKAMTASQLLNHTLLVLLDGFGEQHVEGLEPATDENLMRKACRDAAKRIRELQAVADASAEVIGGYFMHKCKRD